MPVHIAEKKSVQELQTTARVQMKQLNLHGLRSQVVGVVDVSGSMTDLYDRLYDGLSVMDGLVTRMLALGMEVDDNGTIPMYALDSGVHELESVTNKNIDGYVQKYIRPHVGGGTNYAPAINAVVQDAEPGDPMLVLFFTDGENYDHAAAEQAIREASRYPIFFQTFGIYAQGRPPAFQFLRNLDTLRGRVIDNAGFSELSLLTVTDEELYRAMLVEYPDFLQKAVKQGMLPWNPNNRPGQKPQGRGWFRR